MTFVLSVLTGSCHLLVEDFNQGMVMTLRFHKGLQLVVNIVVGQVIIECSKVVGQGFAVLTREAVLLVVVNLVWGYCTDSTVW